MYFASRSHKDANLRPYSWYLRFVVEGAKQHGLPPITSGCWNESNQVRIRTIRGTLGRGALSSRALRTGTRCPQVEMLEKMARALEVTVKRNQGKSVQPRILSMSGPRPPCVGLNGGHPLIELSRSSHIRSKTPDDNLIAVSWAVRN